MDRFYVVTGGPGSGKSTLIDALAARGIATSPEAGRAVIRNQVAIEGPALPWADRAAFAEQMLGFELRSYRAAEARDVCTVFDRGVPDVAGYLRLCGLPLPDHVTRATQRFGYNPTVFVAPPWGGIFAQDAERSQDFAEARATCRIMREVYTELGYKLVDLPLASVETRVAFVIDRITLAT